MEFNEFFELCKNLKEVHISVRGNTGESVSIWNKDQLSGMFYRIGSPSGKEGVSKELLEFLSQNKLMTTTESVVMLPYPRSSQTEYLKEKQIKHVIMVKDLTNFFLKRKMRQTFG